MVINFREDAKELSSLKSLTKDKLYKKSPKILLVKVVVVVEVEVVVIVWFYLFKINERYSSVKFS